MEMDGNAKSNADGSEPAAQFSSGKITATRYVGRASLDLRQLLIFWRFLITKY
jgi:hypothetical protein